MKLVIQNGCRHTLTRKEFEPMIKLFPKSWDAAISTITFYGGQESELKIEYYPKKKILGLFWPKESQCEDEKKQALQELFVSLQYLSENKDFSRMKKSDRDHYLEKTKEIREKCVCRLT